MRVAAIAVAVIVVAACTGRGPQRAGAQPSWRGGSASTPSTVQTGAPVTFAPSSQPAARYNERPQAPPRSPLGDGVTAAVHEAARAAGMALPIADARLFRACAELAEVVPEEGNVLYSLVEFALQRNGIIEPSPHLLVVWSGSAPEEIVRELQKHIPKMLAEGHTARLGIGSAKRKANGEHAIVFALQGSFLTTNPIPRSVAAGGGFTLDAVVDARYKDPEVFVTRDNGTTERVEIDRGNSGGFKARVACGTRKGRQQVEITASDTLGSTVLANFPVWCATDPPSSLTVIPTSDDEHVSDPLEAEKRLLAMLNRERAAANLASVAWDDRVAAVARAYSLEMRTTKVVAHISPTTGSAADRVRAGKIKTAVVLENVARAYGIGEAHQGLMNSPGHRANILSHHATHVGIGIVYGDEVSGRREIFITQVFTRVPPKVDNQKSAEEIRKKILAVRQVNVNPKLTAIAQGMADQLAAGKTREQAYPAVKRQVDALGNKYARVGSVVTAASELDSIDGPAILGDAHPDDVGIGIAQGVHPEIGEGAIWIVVLLAENR